MSEGLGGAAADGYSGPPAISGDGRFIVYPTAASNIVPNDTNFAFDVIRRDLLTGDSVCVSLSTTGVPAAGDSHSPAITGDGRYVAFVSGAANLVATDSNSRDDVFVADLVTGTITRIGPQGLEADGDSSAPSISADGGIVAFVSTATNLVSGDTNNSPDVFVWRRSTGAIERVSVSSSEAQARGASFAPAVSGNGDRIAFESVAGNLVGSDRNGARDIFLRDLSDGTTSRVSTGPYGAANRESREPSLSSTGRKVAFSSSATNLVARDTNGRADVFVRDVTSRTTIRVNVAPRGIQANAASGGGVITAAGTTVVFHSNATNLVAFDANRVMDVFSASTGRRRYTRIQGSTAADTALACSRHAFRDPARTVVVANPRVWYEAISAVSLAGAVRGPLLFAGRSSVATATLEELERLGAAEVIIVGGTASVDETVAAAIRTVPGVVTVRRVTGATQYKLAAAVASETISLKGAAYDGTVFVASGSSYVESLAGLPLMAADGRPVVFVRRSTGAYSLPARTRRAVILGGTGSVSSSVEARLRSQLGATRVTRLSGVNRYATAVKTAEWGARYRRLEWDGVSVVSATRPADAACAGVMAAKLGSLVVVVSPTSLPAATRARLVVSASRINQVRVIGPTTSINRATSSAIQKAMGY